VKLVFFSPSAIVCDLKANALPNPHRCFVQKQVDVRKTQSALHATEILLEYRAPVEEELVN
jgi:hypothetical protein